jgi:hypothetical protein
VTNIALAKGFLEQEYGRIKRAYLQGRKMPRCIDFNRDDSSLLLSGWYELQGDSPHRYRWTEQRFSLFLPPGTSGVEICSMVPPFDTVEFPVTMGVNAGEGRIASRSFAHAEWQSQLIPFERPTTKLTKAVFELSNSYCPKEKGKGEDARKLGLAVSRIAFLQS